MFQIHYFSENLVVPRIEPGTSGSGSWCWTTDSLYAFKFKSFRNTRHTVTFGIPLSVFFLKDLSLSVRVTYSNRSRLQCPALQSLDSVYVLAFPTIIPLSRIRQASSGARQKERDVSYSTNIDILFGVNNYSVSRSEYCPNAWIWRLQSSVL
jgi:hypothetical protein